MYMYLLHITLRQKWGGGIYSNIQLVLSIHPPMLHARSTITMTATAFWKSSSFAECVLQEISGACVDTKLRGIEVTCIVGGGRR